MRQLNFRAMGCRMAATVDSDLDKAQRLLEQAPEWFALWEASLSRFRPNSELSRLNRRAGEWVAVSVLLEEVLSAALDAADESAGLVTPTILQALEAAGYDCSFTELVAAGPVGGRAVAPDAKAPGGWHLSRVGAAGSQVAPVPPAAAISLDKAHHTVRLSPGVQLDLGGIAKGWAADQAARLLGQAGPALVDAGGDLAASGPKANGDPWAIRVIDPFNHENELALVLLTGGGIATSGRDYRRWQMHGLPQHHIIDPRTGRPAVTDVLSATVVAPGTQAAETAARCALILGSEQGLAWLDQRPGLAGLLVLEDGTHRPSSRWNDHIWRQA